VERICVLGDVEVLLDFTPRVRKSKAEFGPQIAWEKRRPIIGKLAPQQDVSKDYPTKLFYGELLTPMYYDLERGRTW
jgi:hypothetical protein